MVWSKQEKLHVVAQDVSFSITYSVKIKSPRQ